MAKKTKKESGVVLLPELVVPDEVESEAREQIQDLVPVAEAVKIRSDADYAAAGDLLTGSIKPALKQLNGAFDPIIASWHGGHRQTIATKKSLTAPLLAAEKHIKELMGEYDVEQTRLKRIEARAAAEEEARAEREAEEARQAEEAVRLLEEGDEEAALELLGLADEGDDEGEEEEEEVAVYVPPVKVDRPKADGITVRMLKRYRVTDPGKIKRAYLVPDTRKIQKIVEALGEGAEEVVGGIEFYEKPSVGAQAR
jgi:hypothetical protein